MREGLAEDDVWIMVEDEFYTTAQAFTTHLHHAEYKRLKALAKEREKVVAAGGFGTDGRSKLSTEGKWAAARADKAKSVSEIMKKIAGGYEDDDDDDDDVDPWVGTQLAGLMDSPRKAQILRAKNMGVGRSETRASMGLPRSSQIEGSSQTKASLSEGHNGKTKSRPESPTRARNDWKRERERVEGRRLVDDEGNEDDLDMPARSAHRAKTSTPFDSSPVVKPVDKIDSFHRHKYSSPQRERTATLTTTRTERSRVVSPPRSITSRKSSTRDTITSNRNESLDLPEPASTRFADVKSQTTQSITSGSSFLARRRAEREKAKKQQEEEKRGSVGSASIEIPTFLF